MSSTMTVTQPEPVMHSQESNEWSSGICDWWQDMPECCFAFWCLSCFACVTTYKFGECVCLPLLDMFGFTSPVTMSMRSSMRERYHIKGSMWEDYVISCCCLPCSWCQMSREMKRRKKPIVIVSARDRDNVSSST